MTQAMRSRIGRPPAFDRNKALDAAMRLFWRHGFEGTSMSMLTRSLGFVAPTIYAAFGSKEALFQEALGYYIDRAQPEPSAADLSPQPVRQRIEAYMRAAALRFTMPAQPPGCMLATGGLQCGADHGSIAGTLHDRREQMLAGMASELSGAQARGEIDATVDCTVLARFYAAVMQGMSVQAIDGADSETLSAIVELALRAWPEAPWCPSTSGSLPHSTGYQ